MSTEPPQDPEMEWLLRRLDPSHVRRRLGIEEEHEAEVFRRAANRFHIENWQAARIVIRNVLRATLLYGRGQRNALDLALVRNRVELPGLPPAFAGFRILHITDLHLDMRPEIPQALIDRVRGLEYDICVLTGDFRAETHGPYLPALEAMSRVRPHLEGPVYGVLGNHDTLRMLQPLEDMGIRMLMNESEVLEREGSALYLAGIDDAHYYQTGNIADARRNIPHGAVSILLSHTPEIYRHARHDGFDLMLSGHTHGGQICLPGGRPLSCNARAPRWVCSGPWRHGELIGYTSRGSGVSVVDARLNCPPEVVIHELQPGPLD